MDYFLMLLLGLILGILLVFMIKPELFSGKSKQFSTLEAMVDQCLEDLDQKFEEISQRIDQRENQILEKIERRVAKSENTVSRQLASALLTSPKVQRVEDLMGQGYSLEEIARKLGMGKGEVELVFHLKEHRDNCHGQS